MNNTWTCPQCGCHDYHYSSNRRSMVCVQCGYMIKSSKQREEDMDYDRVLTLAKEHLQVGDWDECKRLVKPLCAKRPADKQLYLILLAAITKGYEDFLFDNPQGLQEAKEYWEKLKKLRSVNGVMREYAHRRMQEKDEMRSREVSSILIVICLCCLATIVSLGFLMAESGWFWVTMGLTILSWVKGINWIKARYGPIERIRDLGRNSENPFT